MKARRFDNCALRARGALSRALGDEFVLEVAS
jgi:hypothetical protein